MNSDEENTSEYSHPPSSEHSTLDSNPDRVVSMMKHLSTGCSDADDSSSSSDEYNSDDDSDAVTAKERSMRSAVSAAKKSNNNVKTTNLTEINHQGIAI